MTQLKNLCFAKKYFWQTLNSNGDKSKKKTWKLRLWRKKTQIHIVTKLSNQNSDITKKNKNYKKKINCDKKKSNKNVHLNNFFLTRTMLYLNYGWDVPGALSCNVAMFFFLRASIAWDCIPQKVYCRIVNMSALNMLRRLKRDSFFYFFF